MEACHQKFQSVASSLDIGSPKCEVRHLGCLAGIALESCATPRPLRLQVLGGRAGYRPRLAPAWRLIGGGGRGQGGGVQPGMGVRAAEVWLGWKTRYWGEGGMPPQSPGLPGFTCTRACGMCAQVGKVPAGDGRRATY
jgi:hypothetical protein